MENYLYADVLIILTDEDVGHEGGGKAEDDDQYVRHGQVNDEEVCDVPHTRRPVHHHDDETVTDEPDDEYHDVGHAKDDGHGRVVAVELPGRVRRVRLGVEQRGGRPRRIHRVRIYPRCDRGIIKGSRGRTAVRLARP